MMRGLLFLSVVAATSVAATLNAQVATVKPDSGCTTSPDGRIECKIVRGSGRDDSALRNRIFLRTDSAMAKRAALGLELRATGTRRDTLGVFVEAVTPKGPAETAGIIEGDRIASINGVDLRTAAGDVDDSYVNGLAAHRLGREVQKLTPGNRVTLRVYSGGRFRDVQVTAGKASDLMRLSHFNFKVPGPGGMMEFNGPGGPEMMFAPEMMGPDMPMMRQRIESSLPRRIQIRTPMRIRTAAPTRTRVYKVDAKGNGELVPADDDIMFEMDDEPFDIDTEIEPIPPAVIRDLAATTIRDAQSALRQLAADGIA
jgi:PDZ domain-containing protein